jgi:hypothetical protein
MIPGDKIEQYLKIMDEAEKKREPFRQYLLGLNGDFCEHLESKLSARTARQHSSIVGLFCGFHLPANRCGQDRGYHQRNGKHPFQKLVEEKGVGFHNTRSTEDSSSKVLRFPRRKQGYRQREGLESFAVNIKKDNKGETWIQSERSRGGWQRWQLRIEGFAISDVFPRLHKSFL